MQSHKLIGKLAEQLALKYLSDQGLKLVISNFYSRFGEIDLIMHDQQDLVFVEVKKRETFAQANESITLTKQKKMIKTAKYYLLTLKQEVSCRFDALLINKVDEIKWLKNVIILY